MHERAAPAKINLRLRLLGPRPDGYTEIETLILPISLADRLTFEPCPGGPFLECDDPSLPADGSNLVLRAARAFSQRVPGADRFRIRLFKNIPHGAGLGGGSSDAAATLLALNQLAGSPLSLSELSAIAATLGSDVPVFLHGAPALCTGRGEIVRPLTPAELPPPMTFLLVKPPFPVPTTWAYAAWRRLRDSGPAAPPREQTLPGGLTLVNDLEPPVFRKYLILETARDWLLQQPGVLGALMSGSGSTLFAVTTSEHAAAALRAAFLHAFGGGWWSAISRWIPPAF